MNDRLTNERCFEQAQSLIPGGVNSPVRAFHSVGGTPIFIEKGQGAFLIDVEGNQYVDYVLSWGPLVLGHAFPTVVESVVQSAQNGTSFGAPTRAETELAALLVSLFSSMDQVRFVNSGTEATMSAIRLARAFTRRDKIIKFSGNYHGHADMLLAQAGSGLATLSLSACSGVTLHSVQDTLVAQYNHLKSVETLFEAHPGQIAGIIVEPVAGNMGLVLPQHDFLSGLRRLCDEHGALLIIDEVMTGFRAAIPGAQTHFDVQADITCLGKVIGGGLPVAAYGARQEIMEQVAPVGNMYQAGTLSGNPLGMAAGLSTLRAWLSEGRFEYTSQLCREFVEGLNELASRRGILVQISSIGTLFGIYFLKEPGRVTNYEEAKRYVDPVRYAQFFHQMLKRGVYFAPSAYEAGFMSSAHTKEDIAKTLHAAEVAFALL
ncbi:MAG: glutamate-1-semialdehyde 2,1-aminomutase [Myxococcaceae bacterium]|nr:glutamate-1-semialdehyde 2,1-aminomutase [Myxococcaceae bacterium]MBH2006218.1 glutamate-1-semialdehyde 2,1-aminomutase [Myxococcaceae bacterium]